MHVAFISIPVIVLASVVSKTMCKQYALQKSSSMDVLGLNTNCSGIGGRDLLKGCSSSAQNILFLHNPL